MPPQGTLFKIAQISAAHGIRGEVKLICFLENPADLARYNPLVTKQGKAVELTVTGTLKDHLIARINTVDDRNAAEMLRGTELYGERAKLPPKNEDEYYVQELVGLSAVLENGQTIGKVTAIHNYGAGDILEIATADEEILLPFKAPFVGDISEGKIIVTLPEYIESEKRGAQE